MIKLAPSWWHSFELAEKNILVTTLLDGIEEVVRKYGCEPRIYSFTSECPIPWAITLNVGFDWGETEADLLKDPGPYQFDLTASFEFGKFVGLRVRRTLLRPTHLQPRVFQDIGREAMALIRNRMDELTEPAAPALTPAEPAPEAPEPAPAADPSLRDDLLSALKSLNFTKTECRTRADQAFAKAPANATLQDLITLALKKENPS